MTTSWMRVLVRSLAFRTSAYPWPATATLTTYKAASARLPKVSAATYTLAFSG